MATVPDLLRLLAVPAFGVAAWIDVRSRRVPNRVWYPFVVLGPALIIWDAARLYQVAPWALDRFVLHVVLSSGIVVPLSYAFWRIGGFGGADAKALMVLAVLFPAYPEFHLWGTVLPLVETRIGVFSMTVLTNTVLIGALYPLGLGLDNAIRGQTSPVMFIGRPVHWRRITETHGRLLETPYGFTRGGLDLDALRMYLEWRGTSLVDLRADLRLRNPETLPEETNEPTDGAVPPDGFGDVPDADAPDIGEALSDSSVPQGTAVDESLPGIGHAPSDWAGPEDPWGARTFLEDIEHGAYGTTPGQLQAGLDVLSEADVVWVSPGIPFLVPMFAGLLVALTYGDILFGVLGLLGVV